MSITLFGILWLFLLLVLFLKRNDEYVLFITLIGMLLQSDDVFTLGPESGMGSQVITSIFFILYSYTIKIKRTNIKFEYSILYIIYFVIIIYMYMFVKANIVKMYRKKAVTDRPYCLTFYFNICA